MGQGRGLTVMSLPLPWHVFAQHLVDVRLPAGALPTISLDHIGIQPQGLIDLAVRLNGSARATPQCRRRLRAELLRDDIERGARSADLVARPFGVVIIRA